MGFMAYSLLWVMQGLYHPVYIIHRIAKGLGANNFLTLNDLQRYPTGLLLMSIAEYPPELVALQYPKP